MIKPLTSTENKSAPASAEATAGKLGCAMDVRQLRESLCSVAMKCANALSAFGASTKNEVLLKKVGYTDASLRKLKNAELEVICQIIHDEGEAYLPEAGAFGYTQDDLTELQKRIMEYLCSFQVDRKLFTSKAKTAGMMREFAMWRHRAA